MILANSLSKTEYILNRPFSKYYSIDDVRKSCSSLKRGQFFFFRKLLWNIIVAFANKLYENTLRETTTLNIIFGTFSNYTIFAFCHKQNVVWLLLIKPVFDLTLSTRAIFKWRVELICLRHTSTQKLKNEDPSSWSPGWAKFKVKFAEK